MKWQTLIGHLTALNPQYSKHQPQIHFLKGNNSSFLLLKISETKLLQPFFYLENSGPSFDQIFGGNPLFD